MPDGTWGKALAKCPFYLHDSAREKTIICEGIFERSRTTTKFRRQHDREEQLTQFCAAHYKKCAIYRAIIEEKYRDE